MNPLLLSAAIAAALGFGSAWKIQDLRMEANENDRLTQQRAQEQEISRLEQARSLQVLTAQNDARVREGQLRADAATSKSAADGLRSALSRAVQTARTAPETCADTSAALGVILTDISEKYSELASTCDRHVSDIKTLMALP